VPRTGRRQGDVEGVTVWEVENGTPFQASGNWIRDRDGAEVWLVAVRCTFDLHADGTTSVAATQEPPVLAPEFWGEPSLSSLKYDSDFHLTKPTTDVIVHAHAYAPHQTPTTQVDVALRVGDVTKALRVTGTRTYERGLVGLTTTPPQPFLRLPIRYERSHGGSEPPSSGDPDRPKFEMRNPIGAGFAPTPGGVVPGVEYTGRRSTSLPAGFGPIPAHWQPRAGHAGTYDDAWQKHRIPLYPHDLDDRFFLCSPEDQRPKQFLRGGERVDLANLTPEGRLSFVLPRLAFRFETMFRGKPSMTHRGSLHSVILEPDEHRVVLVWHTALRAHADVHRLDETYVSQLRVLNSPGVPGDDDESK